MIRVGNYPYLECSSKGDKRFSAFFAKVRSKSIEERYQAAKVFSDGSTGLSWRQAKGKKAVNMDEVSILYKELWKLSVKPTALAVGYKDRKFYLTKLKSML